MTILVNENDHTLMIKKNQSLYLSFDLLLTSSIIDSSKCLASFGCFTSFELSSVFDTLSTSNWNVCCDFCCFRSRYRLTLSRVARRRSFITSSCSSGGKYCSLLLVFNRLFFALTAFFRLYSSYLPVSFNFSMCFLALSLLFRQFWMWVNNEFEFFSKNFNQKWISPSCSYVHHFLQ